MSAVGAGRCDYCRRPVAVSGARSVSAGGVVVTARGVGRCRAVSWSRCPAVSSSRVSSGGSVSDQSDPDTPPVGRTPTRRDTGSLVFANRNGSLNPLTTLEP